MSVNNLSLAKGSYSQFGEEWGILVKEAEDVQGPRDIRLVWSTYYDDQTNYQWVISIDVTTVYLKGGGQLVGSSIGIGTKTQTFDASECNMVKPNGDDGLVWWSHSLDVDGLLQQIAGESRQWLYSSRKYDGMDFVARVHSNWKEGTGVPGQSSSETISHSFSINYCPVYVLSKCYYDNDDVFVIEYSTTWTRKDDRFALENSNNVTGGASNVEGRPLVYRFFWGTVAARGRIELPVSYLTEHVAGKDIFLNIRFNASFRPINLPYSNAMGTITVGDNRKCNAPKLTLISSDVNGIAIRTEDSGLGGDIPPEWVTVKMVGSRYSEDQVRVRCGNIALFRFAPFGKTVQFQAIGSTESGAVSGPSNTVSTKAASGPGAIVIDDIDSLNSVVLPYRLTSDDMGPTVETKPVSETVKLAGRMSPSAYYGTGTETNISFSAAMYDDDGSSVEDIATWGDVMVRFPDGRRYIIVPTVRINRMTSRIISVDISGEEAGG